MMQVKELLGWGCYVDSTSVGIYIADIDGAGFHSFCEGGYKCVFGFFDVDAVLYYYYGGCY
jgi:hypothetical protein